MNESNWGNEDVYESLDLDLKPVRISNEKYAYTECDFIF